MVGPGGLEPPTSRLSGVRSNQLSYGPMLSCNFYLSCDHIESRPWDDIPYKGGDPSPPSGRDTLLRLHPSY